MKFSMMLKLAVSAALTLSATSMTARAEPWTAMSDMGLRDDIELLADYGIIDGPISTWPIPTEQIAASVQVLDESSLPPHVRLALARVRATIPTLEKDSRPHVTADAAVTSKTPVVNDFGSSARDKFDTSASVGAGWKTGYAKLQVGYQGDGKHGTAKLDGSYIAQSLGNWLIYAGAIDQWWGPGWVSSLILSNNARPMPRIGIMRKSPYAIDFPILRWLGPWRFSGSVAVMDGPRPDYKDPYLFNARFEFQPARWLQIGLFHDGQLCGKGRSCKFKNWLDSFGVAGLSSAINSGNAATDPGNVMSGVDIRTAWRMGHMTASLYGQLYAEDSSSASLFKDTARQIGGSLTGPLGNAGWSFRAVGEYSDTAGVSGLLGGAHRFGDIYGHYIYFYGYRYRGDAIGASFDNDSRVASAMLGVNAPTGQRYWLKYHHAILNTDNAGFNTVSLDREVINIGEASAEFPTRLGKWSLTARYQDDSPNTPGRKHAVGAVEGAWSINF